MSVIDRTITPLDDLTADSLDALAEYQRVGDAVGPAHGALFATFTPEQHALWLTLEPLVGEQQDAEIRLHLAEVARHFPAIAPTLTLLWEHCIDTRLPDTGRCCTRRAGAPATT
jgi:hypothetical protein